MNKPILKYEKYRFRTFPHWQSLFQLPRNFVKKQKRLIYATTV